MIPKLIEMNFETGVLTIDGVVFDHPVLDRRFTVEQLAPDGFSGVTFTIPAEKVNVIYGSGDSARSLLSSITYSR